MSEPWIIEIGMNGDGLYWGKATTKEEYEKDGNLVSRRWIISGNAGYRGLDDWASKRMLIRRIKKLIRQKEKEWAFSEQVIEWQPKG